MTRITAVTKQGQATKFSANSAVLCRSQTSALKLIVKTCQKCWSTVHKSCQVANMLARQSATDWPALWCLILGCPAMSCWCPKYFISTLFHKESESAAATCWIELLLMPSELKPVQENSLNACFFHVLGHAVNILGIQYYHSDRRVVLVLTSHIWHDIYLGIPKVCDQVQAVHGRQASQHQGGLLVEPGTPAVYLGYCQWDRLQTAIHTKHNRFQALQGWQPLQILTCISSCLHSLWIRLVFSLNIGHQLGLRSRAMKN